MINSLNVKELSKTITLEEFIDRFFFMSNSIKDINTEKIYFCPYDLGFKFTIEDCKYADGCGECWREMVEYLKNREGLYQTR